MNTPIVGDIRVRLVQLFQHLINCVFPFLGLSYHTWTFTIFGYSLYLGHKNGLTSHLLLHEAEMRVLRNIYIPLNYLLDIIQVI